MSTRFFKSAGVISAILGVLLIVVLFALFGTVDLIYMKDGREVYRQEKVSVLDKIDDPVANSEILDEGACVDFTYTSGNDTKELNLDKPSDLKIDILKKVVINLFTFKWDELDNDIIMDAK